MSKWMMVGRGNGPKRLKEISTTLSSIELREKIESLDPARRVLFEVLVLSRRRTPVMSGSEDDNPSNLTLLRDAFAYARDVAEPEIELAEIRAVNNYAHPSASSSLAEGMFLYTEVV